MNKALNSLRNLKKGEQEFEVRYRQPGGLGRWTPACLWHLWSSSDWECESSIRKFSSNFSQIDLSSLTLSVLWVVEELDAVDSEWYPWFYSGWPPKESIGRTDRFVAGASSDFIFWRDDPIVVFWVLPNHDVFTLFFRDHFLCFLLPFFFKVQSKIGVCIIHGRALYKGKYGNNCDVKDIFHLTFCKLFDGVVFSRAEFMTFCCNVHVLLIIAAQLLYKVSMEFTSLRNKKRYLQLLR